MTYDMKLFSRTLIAAIFALVCTISTDAQPRVNEEWREKMMNAKIAFLTSEIGLSTQEAQAFWPIYNEVNMEKDKSMRSAIRSYRALENAVNEGKTGKEIEKLLNEYLDAQNKQRAVDSSAAEKFRKVLSVEKLAKLYIAEEKFRRQQIQRLHRGNGEHKRP